MSLHHPVASARTDGGRRRGAADTAVQVIVAARSAHDREWLAELLRSSCGHRVLVRECADGAAVLRALKPHRPPSADRARVLLLGAIADLDPLQLLALLRPHGRQAPCPIVVITPGLAQEIGPALLRAGANDYLGESWLSPQGLARAVANARVRWAIEWQLRQSHAAQLARQANC